MASCDQRVSYIGERIISRVSVHENTRRLEDLRNRLWPVVRSGNTPLAWSFWRTFLVMSCSKASDVQNSRDFVPSLPDGRFINKT